MVFCLKEAISNLWSNVFHSTWSVCDDNAPTSFIVSKYWVTRTKSMTSFDIVPGTFTEKASTLSLSPTSMVWCWHAYHAQSPSACFICRIFSASAFSLATTFILAAVHHMWKVNDRLISIQGKRIQTYRERERERDTHTQTRNNVQFKMNTYRHLPRS